MALACGAGGAALVVVDARAQTVEAMALACGAAAQSERSSGDA